MPKAGLILFLLFLLFLFSTFANAEDKNANAEDKNAKAEDTQIFPLGNKLLKERGIEFPLPFGISTVYTQLSDETKVVKMEMPMIGEIENINIINSESKTSAYNLRADLWLLPFMNIYALTGHLSGVAKSKIKIDDNIPLINSDVEMEIETEYHGTTLGFGTTFVAGTTSGWVVSLDMNYSETQVNLVEGDVTSYMIAPRFLYSMVPQDFPLTVGVGVPYFNTKQTVRAKISGENARRESYINVDIEDKKNWNVVVTASFDLEKNMQLASEIGFYDRTSFSVVLIYRI